MNKLMPIALCVLLIASCNSSDKKEDREKETGIAAKVNMMNADREFSLLSEKKGLRTAYTEFIDSNGVLLRPGYKPMDGADALDYIIQSNDSGFMMTWEPKNATLSSSGDLGYTYGIFSLKPADADTIIYGTYVTIWRRQLNGNWKFVLQSGNEGLQEAAE
jgi:ketosteroid isomerase-like protein